MSFVSEHTILKARATVLRGIKQKRKLTDEEEVTLATAELVSHDDMRDRTVVGIVILLTLIWVWIYSDELINMVF